MSYHYSEHQRDELQREMSRVRDKDTSVDYKRDDVAREWQKVADKLQSWQQSERARGELQNMRQQSQQHESARTQQRETTQTHERSGGEFVFER
jgi:predicted  nucleic acid-binding Zn-ribbon protein